MRKPKTKDWWLALGVLAIGALLYISQNGIYPRYFDIEWDEEVQLHDGRVIVVHVKRTFERRSKFNRWLAYEKDTEISLNVGSRLGDLTRKFERYDVNMIEYLDGSWYFGLEVTTGIPPKRLVDPAYPVLILQSDGTERAAKSWADIPDFPRLNVLPVTPSPEGIAAFNNSFLTWQEKMEHWRKNPRAAGDDGVIIQRRKKQEEMK